MSLSADVQSKFARILNQEIEQTQLLLTLLRREYELLSTPTDAEMKAVLEQKKQQLLAVEQSVTQHNRLLSDNGLSPNREGTEQLLRECNAGPQLLEQWQTFSLLLSECQKQNEINGGALRLNQHQVGQALDILRGIAASEKTYGPEGQTRPNSTSNSLGKA
ncbi:MAG: flagellar protein FlgN [Candidatus Thiodiazotropha sp.]